MGSGASMSDKLIVDEELNFLTTCGQGEVFEGVLYNIDYLINVSKSFYKMGRENKAFETMKNPRTRAKYVTQWLKDNNIKDDEKPIGLWKVIGKHGLDHDRVFLLIGLYVVQREIESFEQEKDDGAASDSQKDS
jgi:hypothetical protein